jgi:lipopolysaccharide transport system permease protein
MLANVKALWAYRGFILGSIRREFQLKYRNSVLGATWAVLNPAAMVAIYTVVFTQVMHARLPTLDATWGYSLYLCAGLFTWGLFAEIITRSQSLFVDQANLIKKVAFPRLSLPLVIIGTALLNYAIQLGLLFVFAAVVGHPVGWSVIVLLPLVGLIVLFAIGLGLVVGITHVFFRDVGQALTVVLGLWFWLTPVVYPVDILPETIRALVVWNPLATLIGAFQQVLVFGRWPEWIPVVGVAGLSLCLCAAALALFRRKSGAIMDEL